MIKVLKKHMREALALARSNPELPYNCRCPVALALKEALNLEKVSVDDVGICCNSDRYDTPGRVEVFIDEWDATPWPWCKSSAADELELTFFEEFEFDLHAGYDDRGIEEDGDELAEWDDEDEDNEEEDNDILG